jgi:nucleoside-diphosphate-sugar epimerase
MRRINGDANVSGMRALRERLEPPVERFVFVSAAEVELAKAPLRGYYEGKRAAEAACQDLYGDQGYVLRPGMVYGKRAVELPLVGARTLPIDLAGRPMEFVFASAPFAALRAVPIIGSLFEPPVSVDIVGRAAAEAAMGTATTCASTAVDGSPWAGASNQNMLDFKNRFESTTEAVVVDTK